MRIAPKWVLPASIALAVACVACAGPLVSPRVSPPVSAGPPTNSPDAVSEAAPTLGGEVLGQLSDDVFEAMLGAITEHRPNYRFRLDPDRLDGDWRLDGDADDGSGPGRLFIALTERPGNLTANPCLDRDFTQGGSCLPVVLPSGDRLFLRNVVRANDTEAVVVALVHADRSGITAEATGPAYTVEELAELVITIEQRIEQLP